ncbi:MAG: hypothetical protein IT426_12745 [Pirellulales bacterium]|nr:hypothetical protein [Pirellulales bacterium]
MSFKSQVNLSIGWNWNLGAVDNGRLDYARQFLDGGGNPADGAWNAKDRLLTAGNSTTLDLAALQTAILGGTLAVEFAAVKALLLVNRGGGTLTVGGAAANEWSAPFAAPGDQIALPPDAACLLLAGPDGWVVDAAHRNLKFAAGGDDAIYSIALVGVLAPV